MSLAVRAHDVFCLYPTPRGHVAALRGLTVDVAAGERVVVHGPNGSGKTTLMRVLIGELAPSAGTVAVCGIDLAGAGEAVRTRLRSVHIGLVDQHHGRSLRPELTVRDNVALPLRRRGMARPERRAAALAALESVGLGAFAGKHPWQLSGGMQQRVAIARALAYRPRLLLMDEPFGSVDAQTREDLEDLLLALRGAGGMTILFVTHDIDESVYVGDRVVVLDGPPGTVRADLPVPLPGPREQIATRELPEFVSLRAEVGRLVRGRKPAKI